jgi:hypothetical protein
MMGLFHLPGENRQLIQFAGRNTKGGEMWKSVLVLFLLNLFKFFKNYLVLTNDDLFQYRLKTIPFFRLFTREGDIEYTG